MQNIKNYLFDWDGTLAKSLDIWFDGYVEVLKVRGIELPSEVIVEKAFGKWIAGLEALGIKDPEVALNELINIATSNMPNVLLYPDVKKVLEALTIQGKNIALLTSSPKDLILPVLKKNDLDKYFQIVLTKESVTKGKPDPEIVTKALDSFNGKFEESVIIGDSENDILTGKNSKVKTILFYPEHNKRFYNRDFLLNYDPDYVIGELIELVMIL